MIDAQLHPTGMPRRNRHLPAIMFALLLAGCFKVGESDGVPFIQTDPLAPRPIPSGEYRICGKEDGEQKCGRYSISYGETGDLTLTPQDGETGSSYAFRAAAVGRAGWWLVDGYQGIGLLELERTGHWKLYRPECTGLKLSRFVELYNSNAFAFKGRENYGTQLCTLRRDGLTDGGLFDILMSANPEADTIVAEP